MDAKSVSISSDAKGVAKLTLVVPGYTLNDASPVMGRPVVVEAEESLGPSPPVACGVITPTDASAAVMHSYPGSSGTVDGLLTVHQTASGVQLKGTLSGLEASTSGGWHVHSGYSCDAGAGVFGHYFAAGGADPWNAVTYTSDSSGVAQLDVSMPSFSMYDKDVMPVFGRTGERGASFVACLDACLREYASASAHCRAALRFSCLQLWSTTGAVLEWDVA